LEVTGGTLELGGEDVLDLSDDADFGGSLFGVVGVGGSPGFALGFLLFLSGGGGKELSVGVLTSLLLGGELVLGHLELSLGIRSLGGAKR